MSADPSNAMPVFNRLFTVPSTAIDRNGHVNNVVYVQWMQDLAVAHWNSVGGEVVNAELGCTWVARSHHIEYLRPAHEGDELEALTWVANIGRVRSLRKYAFRRTGDGRLIARGETDWVFVSVSDGRPAPIPKSIHGILPVSEDPLQKR
jgi:acyl-CoA thioester hydrolase